MGKSTEKTGPGNLRKMIVTTHNDARRKWSNAYRPPPEQREPMRHWWELSMHS